MIRDRNIEWARQRDYFCYTTFNGYTPDTQASLGAGVPIWADLGSTTELTGLTLDATADAVSFSIAFPSYWDIQKEIGIRWHMLQQATAALTDSVTPTTTYNQSDNGEALVTPATALDTVIPATLAPTTTAMATFYTNRGIIAANTFDENALDGTIAFLTDFAYSGYTNGELHVLGCSIDYYPRWTVGGPNTNKDDRIN
jgi:hypothetical protein